MGRSHDLSECERGHDSRCHKDGSLHHSCNEDLLVFSCYDVKGVLGTREFREESNHRQHCQLRQAVDWFGLRHLSRIVKANRWATLPKLTSTFSAGTYVNVKIRTVQCSLRSIGFGSRQGSRFPLPTQRRRAVRIFWARKHRNLTAND